MEELTTAEVPLSFFEHRVVYRVPIFEKWERDKGAIVDAVFRALREWNIGLENVDGAVAPKTAAEIQVNFRLPHLHMTLQIGLWGSSLVLEQANWSQQEVVKGVGKTAIAALRESTGAEIANQHGIIVMHLRPRGKSLRDITSRLVAPVIAHDNGSVITYGVSVYRGDTLFVVDNSVVLPGALFVRIGRTFAPAVELNEIAQQLEKDEASALEILGLRLEQR